MTTPEREPVTIRRSDRARHARLVISEDGDAVVVLPRRAPAAVADVLVARHADWIARHRSRIAGERAVLAARRPLAAGRVLMVDGRPLRVRVEPPAPGTARGRVLEDTGELIVRLGSDGRTPDALLEAWLRDAARAAISRAVATRAPELEVRPGRISIRDQRTRWASASGRGNLSFSWRLVLAPPFVLDAIVVHELAHLRYRGHGPRFWRLVERHAPRTPEARRWLHDHARELRAALDDIAPPSDGVSSG